jgi:hypothetical protein
MGPGSKFLDPIWTRLKRIECLSWTLPWTLVHYKYCFVYVMKHKIQYLQSPCVLICKGPHMLECIN